MASKVNGSVILLAIRKIQMLKYNHVYLKQQKNQANHEREHPVNSMF